MTAKQLEQETGCKIMVRGRGSMRDKKKEEQNRGKPNWEHLSDELHVLITVEDSENRAAAKLQRAVDEIKKLLVPSADGEDELKKRQLMELAIINGTYRDSSKPSPELALSAGLPSSAGNTVLGRRCLY
ncbi:protein quaking-B-like [Pollicipes pollicipes]|uniref:protein quaking-B-like n=1 Tax=Pollicipes pollicipes TaxID=41117 RepID=UPI0018856746|nr:protein quaking-B-like [Pollicipes pollicipes]